MLLTRLRKVFRRREGKPPNPEVSAKLHYHTQWEIDYAMQAFKDLPDAKALEQMQDVKENLKIMIRYHYINDELVAELAARKARLRAEGRIP